MIEMGATILLGIIAIVSLVIFVMVLIKQFKNGGVLHGLLGLITCGLYTFIWGWIKHRQFGLTKMMTIWSVITILSIVLQVVFGAAAAMSIAKQFGAAKDQIKVSAKQKRPGAIKVRKPAARNVKPSTGRKVAVGSGAQVNADSLTSAAMALWQDGRYSDPERAVSNWSKVIAARPNSAEAYNNRGLGHYNAGRYSEAIKDYDRALALKANYAVAFNNRGNARYEMAQYPAALADFTASLRIDPEYGNAHSNRGLTHFRLKQIPKACQDFQKACELGDCEMLKWAMSDQICK